MAIDLPCDGDGVCMVCKAAPPEAEVVECRTCATPWHVQCLSAPPESMASLIDWQCPDCSPPPEGLHTAGAGGASLSSAAAPAGENAGLIAAIRAIEEDSSLTEREKARKRQELIGGTATASATADEEDVKGKKVAIGDNDVLALLDDKFKCVFCMQLPERPVSTPCGHNFCLKCFQKWVTQGKSTCAKCRTSIPLKMAAQPRINLVLVAAIRMAKIAKRITSDVPQHVYHFLHNENRPDKAFTTERAKKRGKANACSGQIFVTVPSDHFGPILAEHDPKRNQGVLVGETWEDRMECRQWGAHFPHVAGIAGQSEYGAQSVALSGGYKDDEDHGDWFLYTGSGGRDLSGNKRTNKEQAFDQEFDKLNQALRVSCLKGYPVRVVRSCKEKRSSYAPESGVRYDGIYRIEKCWKKIGNQGTYMVCRYLFVRCDNEPAPWTSDEHGDRPRPLPVIRELKNATDISERTESPAWDYVEEFGWKWMKPPPISKKPVTAVNPEESKRVKRAIRHAQSISVREKLLKEFSCLICRNVMVLPLTTPCGHNFCKQCLLGSYADQSFVKERTCGGRTLRAKKIVKTCPNCPTDIADFLQNPQINRELMDLIVSLQHKSDKDTAEQQNGPDAVLIEECIEDVGEEALELAYANGDVNLAKEQLVEEGMPSGANPLLSSKRKKTAVPRTGSKRTRKSEQVNDDAGHKKLLNGKISDAADKKPVNENKQPASGAASKVF
ncbi:E3 ubiquitin-protein ligase ORTHRUS 2-like [Phoenix dactylifera]|uniref:RING-type E3 ubiquitin transferase n=1 Tax=Phoenix dactylifera TaxID=42345 RepID=A0A8B9ASE8_PHODC|nr:E3 ubiquitin-protein ligase ORTHRUS 2-like [Phoenix dactylifera]